MRHDPAMQRLAQFFRRRLDPRMGQSGKLGRITLTADDGLQHGAAGATGAIE
jgi:hypothetical protein